MTQSAPGSVTHTVYIALGSNVGDRLANLQAAVAALPPEVRPLQASQVYETPPWGFTGQTAFLNQVLKAETELDPSGLLEHLKRLEARLGRQASFRYGPRSIDLDILLYDALVLKIPGLTIPHARLAERAFVLVPLAELDPGLRHPVLGLPVSELLAQVDAAGIIVYK
jgi:2-amino-4-hydroxy-6-hydroxymethyldihydropteridine diphosphokinase